MKKFLIVFFLSIFLSAFFLIGSSASFSPAYPVLTDGNVSTYAKPGTLTVSSEGEKGLISLYLIFDKPCGVFTVVSENGQSAEVNENDFLHLFLDLEVLFSIPQQQVTLQLGDALLAEISVFSEGDTIPDDVQRWSPPHAKADLMLFGAHSDDEHLFFGGIVPLYAGEKGIRVQAVYFTNHWDTHVRTHELLNGLWTAGMQNYPVIGPFPDLYSMSLDGARAAYTYAGYGEEDFLTFEVEMLRRFKPSVLVSHDIEGEYGHGTHRLLADTLLKALTYCGDTEQFAPSAVQYGVWEPEKVYFHLWKENPILLDLDQPLESFGGKSAFEVAKEGYACHLSQQWTWFTRWVNVDSASSIRTYSPMQYGLVKSHVGEDIAKNDFMEHIVPIGTLLSIEADNDTTAPPPSARETDPPQTTSVDPEDNSASFAEELEKQNAPKQSAVPFLCCILGAEILLLTILGILIWKWKRHG